MVDYAELCLRLKRQTAQLYDAMLRRQFDEARNLSALIATDARLMSSQITLEEEKNGARHPRPRKV